MAIELKLDARYVRSLTKSEPQVLKYWERGQLTLRPVRDTPLGPMLVGQTWVCPLWLFEKLYEPA